MPFILLLAFVIIWLIPATRFCIDSFTHICRSLALNIKILEGDVLELDVKFIILGYIFVVPQDLLGDLFLSLGGLLLLDLLLEVFGESFPL
jgi:hypothetical protein